MPHKNSSLPKDIHSIPAAETAKLAIVRPTVHFGIATPDNPNMVRTLRLQQQFVNAELEKVRDNLNAKQLRNRKKRLVRKFQKKLAAEAFAQQNHLLEKMNLHGIPTLTLLEDKGQLRTGDFEYYTDQIFATDTGQYYDNNGQLEFISANFKNQQRQQEERLATAQAENIGANVINLVNHNGEKIIFEGGDIRQMPGRKLFFIGQGHRTDPEAATIISETTGYYVVPITLLQPQFYHLDCCFLPLANDAAVIYEGEYQFDARGKSIFDENGWPVLIKGTETMTVESREFIRRIYPENKLILISKNEAMAFATNAAILQRTEDDRFKMFVNGDRNRAHPDEAKALAQHQISFKRASLEKIMDATEGLMDIIEVPYRTMHGSGGSIRCTVQEVACHPQSLHPHKNCKHHFSKTADKLESKLYSNNSTLGYFSNHIHPEIKEIERKYDLELPLKHNPS